TAEQDHLTDRLPDRPAARMIVRSGVGRVASRGNSANGAGCASPTEESDDEDDGHVPDRRERGQVPDRVEAESVAKGEGAEQEQRADEPDREDAKRRRSPALRGVRQPEPGVQRGKDEYERE